MLETIGGSTHLTCKHTKYAFMKIHNWVITALVPIYDGIRVQSHNQVVSHLACLLKKIQMTNMEQIKCTRNVYLRQ